jgi:pimeloyl-ACP methyl ester carboxylesterase
MPARLRKLLLAVLSFAALIAAAVCLLIYLQQDRLLFYPQPLSEADARAVEKIAPRSERFELKTSDGTHLRGWLVRGPAHGTWPLVIYFGGNAEEVSWLLPEFSRIPTYATLLVNYRGYGSSEGSPSERAMFNDALEAYDKIVQRPDIDARRVIVMGRSLGTGVATYVASQRPIAGAVLISPYDSMVAVAHSVYPFLPVSLLLRHRFESDRRAPSIQTPLLALAAAQDTVISPDRSRRLVEKWGGATRFELLDGVDHNTITMHPHFWPLVMAFLTERGSAQPGTAH